MIIPSLRFAFRNLLHTRAFTAINIAGLSISLTAFILMALYIENEFSYDIFNKNASHVYRVVDDKQTNALRQHTAGSAGPMAPALLNDLPQVKQAARIIGAEAVVKYKDKIFEERRMYFADAGIFNIFSFPMLKGSPRTALVAPMSVVLTQATAAKYFGQENPVDKILTLDGKDMKVTGVIKNVPANSHIDFDILISMATAQLKDSGYDWLFTNWYSNNFYTYILLQDGADPGRLVAQFDQFAQRNKANTATTKHHYNLEKLTDIYLYSDRENQAGKTGNISSLYIFGAVAVFILLLACINFINLSTARAAERTKEIAVKKVNGVSRKQLMLQFFIESFLMVSAALLIALLIVFGMMPAFNDLAGVNIHADLLTPVHLLALGMILLLVSLLSGSYPAFILSAYSPAAALKGSYRSSVWSVGIRKVLVVFQFTVSIILIISSIVVYRQLQYMQKHDLGFRSERTLIINFEGDNLVKNNYRYIKNELLQIKGVESISASSSVPGLIRSSGWSMDFAKKTGDTVHTELAIFLTDFNFMKQYHVPMVAGRGLSESFAADTVESMVINQTALRKLGFNNAEEAIGVKVGMYPNDARVIGVYKDFNFESLQKAIEPLAIRIMPNKFRVFSLQVNMSNIKQTITDIEKTWKMVAPQRPLEYTFLDESFNQQYKAELQFGQIFGIFTGLAICIACFGLFGLVLFSVKQRTKEIGIRKVIGASVSQIAVLLSKDLITLVVIAIAIATPIGLLIMNKWIQDFAYRADINWWIFAASGLLAVLIALVTVSYQAVGAAMANPVKSLKME